MSSNRSLDRVIETLVFAPLGAGAKFVDEAPAALNRARQDLLTARYLGRLAVAQGVAEVKARLDGPPAERRGRPRAPVTSIDRSRPEVGEPAEVERLEGADRLDDVDDRSSASVHDVAVDELALPDYDHLPAIDIVARLGSLSPSERDDIGRYERAHRNRGTVLGKLSQLENEP